MKLLSKYFYELMSLMQKIIVNSTIVIKLGLIACILVALVILTLAMLFKPRKIKVAIV